MPSRMGIPGDLLLSHDWLFLWTWLCHCELKHRYYLTLQYLLQTCCYFDSPVWIDLETVFAVQFIEIKPCMKIMSKIKVLQDCLSIKILNGCYRNASKTHDWIIIIYIFFWRGCCLLERGNIFKVRTNQWIFSTYSFPSAFASHCRLRDMKRVSGLLSLLQCDLRRAFSRSFEILSIMKILTCYKIP